MSFTKICDVSDVATNSVKKFAVNGFSVLVVNYGEGFLVIPPICPHMEEQLEESAIVVRCAMTCSKHLWAWNLKTLEKQGTETEKPLAVYESKEEGGAIYADVDKELVYEFEEEGANDDDFFK